MENVPRSPEGYRKWWAEEQPDIPYGLCWCGCGKHTTISKHNTIVHGNVYVAGEPRRFLRGHSRRIGGPHYEERDCGHDTPCWVWLHAHTTAGYGRYLGQYVHRMYYERANGQIPDGLSIHHRCGNPPCCNPEHLQAVTHAENCRLGRRAKTDAGTVSDIRHLHATGRYGLAELGVMFDLSKQHIREIVTGNTWS